MEPIFLFLQSDFGAAVFRGFILGAIIVLCFLVWGLHRMLRHRFQLLQDALDMVLTRIGPEERKRDFEGIVRSVLKPKISQLTDDEG